MQRVPARDRLKFIQPQLPRLVEEPPTSDDWIHEIKYDGYRTQVILDWDGARAYTKTGIDWTSRYWPIVTAAEALGARSAILDGEVIAPTASGAPDFHALRSAMAWNAERLAFVAFDLLHLDGKDLRPLPVVERRAMLWDLVRPADGIIQFSQHVEGGGAEFFHGVEKLGLEGMVSKRRGSPYRSGESDAWLKIKCYEFSEMDLLGVKREHGKPAMALMGQGGKYAGSAFITLPKEIRERLWKRVQAGRKAPVGAPSVAGVEWLKPGIKARVKHLRGEAKLRHASVKGIVED
ncbi:DNA ligase [Mesorhizobium sp. BR1-1-3]|uniref:ATP-dependent DNA ligase n=1 Tax=Mesorhizobium sp. BR1-1-3 TaxID=2876651 RepID=UPI001CD12B53|nr:RNA ligase family protein [Mesorhizobium sp. BR1-1-3]MBZ9888158.1 DNA ligase [Mesorhizobium sp. BR1-1-3]